MKLALINTCCMIFTLFLFPHPCMAVWDGEVCVESEIVMHAAPSCEVLLPQMFDKILKKTQGEKGFSHIKTFQGPGPFTALRASKAFAHGLALGYGAELICPSFFDVFPPNRAQKMAIHTGIPRWIVQSGEIIDELSPEHIPVSSELFSLEATLNLAKCLAQGHRI